MVLLDGSFLDVNVYFAFADFECDLYRCIRIGKSQWIAEKLRYCTRAIVGLLERRGRCQWIIPRLEEKSGVDFGRNKIPRCEKVQVCDWQG